MVRVTAATRFSRWTADCVRSLDLGSGRESVALPDLAASLGRHGWPVTKVPHAGFRC